MSRKYKLAFVITVILLVAVTTIASARGWEGPLYQTGMDMPTATMQPASTQSPATPQPQVTATPRGVDAGSSMPSPSMTSIFTGYTPYPNDTSTNYSSMGGCGMMGGSSGMSAGGSMGTGGMGMSSGATPSGMGMSGVGSMGTSGMGSMGAGSMAMSCSMMSGAGMSGSMSGAGMSDDYWLSGMDMDMDETSGYVESDASPFSDPWLLLGWILLVLVVIAILAGAAFGIVWIIRRSGQDHPA